MFYQTSTSSVPESQTNRSSICHGSVDGGPGRGVWACFVIGAAPPACATTLYSHVHVHLNLNPVLVLNMDSSEESDVCACVNECGWRTPAAGVKEACIGKLTHFTRTF